MKIGVPREIKNNENRVGLVPGGVLQLVNDGHEVFIQSTAGEGIGISDQDFIDAGAKIVPTLESVFEVAEMIVKVKEPQPIEIALLKPHHLLYTYLHLAADKELTVGLMKSGATCIAYETIEGDKGGLPLLMPMSEVAGKMATQVGAALLQNDKGGKGILLGGVPGVRRAKVAVIGCGIAGTNAIKIAMGMGASVTAIDLSTRRLAELDDLFESRLSTLHSNPVNIEKAVTEADLVIGAVLLPGAKAPKLVTREHIKKMEAGSVVVDIAIDQGGCIETCKPTTHEKPTYVVDEVIHYSVANIPGAAARTSTYALTNVTLPFARVLAKHGKNFGEYSNTLLKGVNTHDGKVVYEAVAESLDLDYTPIENYL